MERIWVIPAATQLPGSILDSAAARAGSPQPSFTRDSARTSGGSGARVGPLDSSPTSEQDRELQILSTMPREDVPSCWTQTAQDTLLGRCGQPVVGYTEPLRCGCGASWGRGRERGAGLRKVALRIRRTNVINPG